jgi:hypothetical protein
MALILFVSALLLGAAVVGWLKLSLYPFEAAALTVVIGLFGWTQRRRMCLAVEPTPAAMAPA